MTGYVRSAALLLAGLFAACGDNLEAPPEDTGLPAPARLTALSLDARTVRIGWERPAGVPDSVLLGWVVTHPGGADSLGPAARALTADSLPPGAASFEVRIRSTGGRVGLPGAIRWAPAARFEGPYTLTEYYAPEPGRLTGFDAGDNAADPAAFAIVTTDPAVAAGMDLYLFGGEGEVEAPLELRSADLFLGSWNATRFSTVTHSGPDLNLPLSQFPDAATFTEQRLVVVDSMICYVRMAGPGGVTHYARLHVRRSGGALRTRTVRISVSLQRRPGVPFACTVAAFRRPERG